MVNSLFQSEKFICQGIMHEFIGSLFPLHQSPFCREMKQYAMIRVDIKKLLEYMYVVNLTLKWQFLFLGNFYFPISLYLQFIAQLI